MLKTTHPWMWKNLLPGMALIYPAKSSKMIHSVPRSIHLVVGIESSSSPPYLFKQDSKSYVDITLYRVLTKKVIMWYGFLETSFVDCDILDPFAQEEKDQYIPYHYTNAYYS